MSDTYPIEDAHKVKWERYSSTWVNRLGLVGFEWDHTYNKDDESRATIEYDFESSWANLNLSDTWDIEPTDERLERTVFHELFELMLWDLLEPVIKYIPKPIADLFDARVHKVVRTLENVLF